ncbi:MAG: hypothetical protein SFY81_15420, partial [Verrucomicrobiota bacterium]|nr:hypothetical protein [Verrucomicrobiota bacterium]
QYLTKSDMAIIAKALDAKKTAILIEALKMPSFRPPAVKPFITYCAVVGLISEHDDLEEAKQACAEHVELMNREGLTPTVATYEWRGTKWHDLGLC